MEINDGLYIDANPGAVRNGVKTFALNIMYNEDGNTLINENGFEKYVDSISKDKTIIGKIELPTGVVLFIEHNSKDTKDEIIYIDNSETERKTITFKGEFSFSKEHPITGTFSYLKSNKLFVTFTEGINGDNETRILYLDPTVYAELTNKELLKPNITVEITDTKLLNLNPDITYPQLNVDIIDGGLKAGGYQFAIAIKLFDDSYSDYSLLSPVYYAACDYGEEISAESVTKKGFKINISDEGTYKLAVVYKSLTTEMCYETSDIVIKKGAKTFEFTTISNLKSISINDITISNIAYIRDEAQTSFNGMLLRANVETIEYSKITDYFTGNGVKALNKIKFTKKDFCHINNIGNVLNYKLSSNLTPDTLTDDEAITTLFKEKDLSNYGSFKEDEVYYFYIALLDIKGKFINAFPIFERGKVIDYFKDDILIKLWTYTVNLKDFWSHLKNDNVDGGNEIYYLIGGAVIYYAKSTPEISNSISQCLAVRDIGTNDVIGNTYKEPFRSTSRIRLYPIEYLVSNTQLPSFYINGVYHNTEIKACFNNLDDGAGNIDVSIDGWSTKNANEFNDSLQEKLKDLLTTTGNLSTVDFGKKVGSYDRLSEYSKPTNMSSEGDNVLIGSNNQVSGPLESGDLVHSVFDSDTVKFSDAKLIPIVNTATFYPVNNSAVSNAGCDSCYKFFDSSSDTQVSIFGKAFNSSDGIGNTNDIPIQTEPTYDTEQVIVSGVSKTAYKKTWDEGTKRIEIDNTSTPTKYYWVYDVYTKTLLFADEINKPPYLEKLVGNHYKETDDISKAIISVKKNIDKEEINLEEDSNIQESIDGSDSVDWILLFADDTGHFKSQLTVYNRGVVDLNRYADPEQIKTPDLYSLDLVPASVICKCDYNEPIALLGDTFVSYVTHRCTCPSKRFHNTGDSKHHNNSIYHIHRLIVTYPIKSRMNFLALHSGKSINSSIVKYIGTSSDEGFNYKANKANVSKLKKEVIAAFDDSEAGIQRIEKMFPQTSDAGAIIELGYRDYTVDNFWHTSNGAAYETSMNWKGFNDVTQFKNIDNIVDKFPSRIIRSNVNNMESNDIGWRKFKADSYKDIPITKGHITNILSDSKSLYIQMLHTLFVTSVKDSLGQGSEGTYIGTSDIFERTPTEIIFNNTGQIGCNNRFSSIITRYGYFVCDNFNHSIYHIKGENDVTKLSDIGMQNWFNKFIESDSTNPYKINGSFFTFDDYTSRLLFTQINNEADKRFTISYNFKTNLWSSFHSYIPITSWSNRLGTFVIDSNNKIYKINAKNKCIYFDGKIEPSIVQFIYNEEPLITKLFNHIEWRTMLIKNWNHLDAEKIKYVYNKTIDRLMVNTDTQSTGWLNTKISDVWYNSTALKYKSGRYIWNGLDDINKDLGGVKILNPNYIPFDINKFLESTNTTKSWYEFSKIQNQFAFITMVYFNRFMGTKVLEGGKEIEKDVEANNTDSVKIIADAEFNNSNEPLTSKNCTVKQAEFKLYNVDVIVTKDTRL